MIPSVPGTWNSVSGLNLLGTFFLHNTCTKINVSRFSPGIILDQPRTNCNQRFFCGFHTHRDTWTSHKKCIKIYSWEVTENRGFKTPGFVPAWKRGLEQALNI